MGFLINKKWKDNIPRVNNISPRVAELVLCLTKQYQLKIVQVYAPTTSHSEDEINIFYNDIDKILENPSHCTIVMGDFNAKVGVRTNPSETAIGSFGLGQRNERGDALIEWTTSKDYNIMNTLFQKKIERRWTWRSPDGETKNEIYYIMTDKPNMITDVRVINSINIGSDHRMLVSNIRLDTKAERKKLLRKKKLIKVHTREIGIKKKEFQLELKNRFTALQELDDIETLNENITEMIQQTATNIAKQNTKRDKSRLSTPTRALMKKRREMVKNTSRDCIEYTDICKTLKKKAKEDIRKCNLDTIRETIETSKSLKRSEEHIS